MDSKEQRQRSHGLLSSGQVVHGSESLPRSYAVVVDAVEIGLLWVFWSQESLWGTRTHSSSTFVWGESRRLRFEQGAYLRAAVARQGLVDLVDVGGHRLEAGVEAVEALLLDLLEGLLGLLGPLPRRLELCASPEEGETRQAAGATASRIVSPPALPSPHRRWSPGTCL